MCALNGVGTFAIRLTSGCKMKIERNHGETELRYSNSCESRPAVNDATVIHMPKMSVKPYTRYMSLSFLVVAMKTGPWVRRR